MRYGFIALVICVSCVAMGQNIAHGFAPPESGKGQRAALPWTDCNYLAPAVSTGCVSQQIEQSSSIYSFLTLNAPKPSRGLFLAQNNSINTLAPRNSLWPNAKSEPIPTQWPMAKIENIPTEWPNARILPLESLPTMMLPEDLSKSIKPAK
jgi:hypothetical protein